ncbi:putative basic proline-rich protein-like [Iris pallida]|uniref:Basic proline-rich protein-like n=1 Tax=Iris pallida TaxID=29817 RepID=A0AAX6FGD3_IRIPA|nr:putative basic proline-rich protein-like [Iris pallida]
MGRLSNEPIIQHFSHPHPLRLSSLDHHHHQQPLAPPASCANCMLPARGGYAYACSPCSYVLHVQCSQMPPLIHHASHRAHPLSLLPLPAYPEGSFDCDACASPGTGFSYHCATCGVDLHTLCASLPLSVPPHPALHPHPLALAFAPPYDNKAFSCDVCGGLGSSQWLYRCAPCEFDAHLECGGRQLLQQQQLQPAPVGRSGSVVVQGSPRAAAVSRSGSGGLQGLARAGSAGGMVRQMVQGLVGSTTQHIGNRFVPGYVGDGGGAVANGGGRGGGRGRGRGSGYNGWNGNGGGGRGGGGGGPPGAWNGYGGGRGQGGGSGGPGGAGNDPNGAQASYDYGYVDSGAGDVSGGWNGYVGGDGGGSGGGNGDGVDYGSVVDAVAGVDYGSVVDAVAGVGSAVLNAFGGGSDNN